MIPIHKVADGVFRGPHPITDDDIIQLKALGIKTVLNLESGTYELFHHKVNKEIDDLARTGINMFHFEMNPVLPPSQVDVDCALIYIKRSQDANLPIYVHCYSGVDRTGVVCAAYEYKVLKRSWDEVYKNMQNLGAHKYYFWWKPFIKKVVTE